MQGVKEAGERGAGCGGSKFLNAALRNQISRNEEKQHFTLVVPNKVTIICSYSVVEKQFLAPGSHLGFNFMQPAILMTLE